MVGSPALPQIYIFHIYTRPKFTQIPDLHGTQIYTNPDLHGTHIYTAQIYTNPFSHIDSKKTKFAQPKFTQKSILLRFSYNFPQFFFKFCSDFLITFVNFYRTQVSLFPGPTYWSGSNFTLFSRFFSLSLLSRNEIEMTGNRDREMK